METVTAVQQCSAGFTFLGAVILMAIGGVLSVGAYRYFLKRNPERVQALLDAIKKI